MRVIYLIHLDKKNEENEENKKNNTFREDFLKKLKEDYYTILNPDGSSFFECVVWLYNFVYHPKFDNEILKIKKFLKNTTVGELPNSPKEYSKIMVENYYNYYGIDKSYQTPKAKSHGKGKKDKEKNKENFPKLTEILKLKINLFLIKESLLIYLKTDGIREADGLEEFYNCLGTNKESYDNAIEKDTDITIYFYEFIQSGFPANLFRTDSPTLMPMSDGVKKTVLEYYYNKIDIEKFREKFYAEFVYKTSSENALMAHIANTLLIKIKQQISKEAKKSS